MKFLILILIFLFSTFAFSHEATKKPESPPAIFKDSVIKRKLKNGKEQKFSGDLFKIVPRVKMKEKETPFLQHRLNLGIGYGPTGLKSYKNHTSVIVEEDFSPVISGRYSYFPVREWDMSLQYISNKTTIFEVGYGF